MAHRNKFFTTLVCSLLAMVALAGCIPMDQRGKPELIAVKDLQQLDGRLIEAELQGWQRKISIHAAIKMPIKADEISIYEAVSSPIHNNGCINAINANEEFRMTQEVNKTVNGQRWASQHYDSRNYVEIIDYIWGHYSLSHKDISPKTQFAKSKEKSEVLNNKVTLDQAKKLADSTLDRFNQTLSASIACSLDDYIVKEAPSGEQFYFLTYAQTIDGIPVDACTRGYSSAVVGVNGIEIWQCWPLQTDKQIGSVSQILSVDRCIGIIKKNMNRLKNIKSNEQYTINSIYLVYKLVPIDDSDFRTDFRWVLRPAWTFRSENSPGTNNHIMITIDAVTGKILE